MQVQVQDQDRERDWDQYQDQNQNQKLLVCLNLFLKRLFRVSFFSTLFAVGPVVSSHHAVPISNSEAFSLSLPLLTSQVSWQSTGRTLCSAPHSLPNVIYGGRGWRCQNNFMHAHISPISQSKPGIVSAEVH